MKLRATLLLLVSMLLIGSLAGAATTDVPAAPAAPAPAVVASPMVASPLCLTNSSKEAPASLPFGNPVQFKTTEDPSTCGACSDVWCQGMAAGAICKTGNPMYRCQNLYGNFCAQDGKASCTCWNKQLP
jgi:hypothetical protein